MNDLDLLISIIKKFEGCRLKAYYCPAGMLTIGWGATGAGITPWTIWSQEQADNRLRLDAITFMLGTKKLLPNANRQVLVALSDFSYNLGLGRLKASTLRKKIIANNLSAAKIQLLRWNKANGKVLLGLDRRRKTEASLF